MEAQHARAVATAMIGLWHAEHSATLAVLGAVPEGGRDYRPHERYRTAWQLATHIATADVWFLDGALRGAFQYDPEQQKQAEAQFDGIGDVVQFYQRTIPQLLAGFEQQSDEELARIIPFFEMMEMPRAQWIGFANNHSVHHRGQLSAYLRSMGARVPPIYGSSADTEELSAGG